MEMLNTLILALLASGAFGMLVSLVIQIGKLFIPVWFPDGSADNWRLGIVAVTAIGIVVAKLAGVDLEFEGIETVATSIAALGATLMPLLILVANWAAKQTYTSVFKGVRWLGKSYTK